jgi:selenocysteine lyase/cysteine desulfurase
VDGAHSFAHIQYKIPDLGADYYGTSLHKWLCAPFGSGLLYVKKEHIGQTYPLLANDQPESTDIRKFESLGTRSFAIEQAIGQALDFQYSIGNEVKQERLQFLKKYWTDAVRQHPRIHIHTDTHPDRSCVEPLLNLGKYCTISTKFIRRQSITVMSRGLGSRRTSIRSRQTWIV